MDQNRRHELPSVHRKGSTMRGAEVICHTQALRQKQIHAQAAVSPLPVSSATDYLGQTRCCRRAQAVLQPKGTPHADTISTSLLALVPARLWWDTRSRRCVTPLPLLHAGFPLL